MIKLFTAWIILYIGMPQHQKQKAKKKKKLLITLNYMYFNKKL